MPFSSSRAPARKEFTPLSWLWTRLKACHDAFALLLGLGLFAGLCVTWSLIAWPLQWILPHRAATRVGRRVISEGFAFYLATLATLRFIRIDLAALDGLESRGPLIVAPNHPSLLDAVLIFARFRRIGCVVKAGLLQHGLLGVGARMAGYIPNDRRQSMIKAAVAELTSGHCLLLFPEGTRSSQVPVGPFTNSLALIAKKARVPVQTVFIEMNQPFLGKGWPLFRRPILPIVIHVRLGQVFPPEPNVRQLTQRLQDYFSAHLNAQR